MSVDIRVERDGDRIRVMPAGMFDLAHAIAVHQAVEDVEPRLDGLARSTSTSRISTASMAAARRCSLDSCTGWMPPAAAPAFYGTATRRRSDWSPST